MAYGESNLSPRGPDPNDPNPSLISAYERRGDPFQDRYGNPVTPRVPGLSPVVGARPTSFQGDMAFGQPRPVPMPMNPAGAMTAQLAPQPSGFGYGQEFGYGQPAQGGLGGSLSGQPDRGPLDSGIADYSQLLADKESDARAAQYQQLTAERNAPLQGPSGLVGSLLQGIIGFGPALQGRPNPQLVQMEAEREGRYQRGVANLDYQQRLADAKLKRKLEFLGLQADVERLRRQKEEPLLALARDFLGDKDPKVKQQGVAMVAEYFKRHNIPVAPGFLEAFQGKGGWGVDTLMEIEQEKTLGTPLDIVIKHHPDLDPAFTSTIYNLPENDAVRHTFGLGTLASKKAADAKYAADGQKYLDEQRSRLTAEAYKEEQREWGRAGEARGIAEEERESGFEEEKRGWARSGETRGVAEEQRESGFKEEKRGWARKDQAASEGYGQAEEEFKKEQRGWKRGEQATSKSEHAEDRESLLRDAEIQRGRGLSDWQNKVDHENQTHNAKKLRWETEQAGLVADLGDAQNDRTAGGNEKRVQAQRRLDKLNGEIRQGEEAHQVEIRNLNLRGDSIFQESEAKVKGINQRTAAQGAKAGVDAAEVARQHELEQRYPEYADGKYWIRLETTSRDMFDGKHYKDLPEASQRQVRGALYKQDQEADTKNAAGKTTGPLKSANAGGEYYYKETGEFRKTVPEADLISGKAKEVTSKDKDHLRTYERVLSQNDEIQRLIPRVLADYPGGNLWNFITTKGKLATGASEDARRLLALLADENIALTLVLSGGGTRPSNKLLDLVQRDTGPSLGKDTQKTALGLIDTRAIMIYNARQQILGLPTIRQDQRIGGPGGSKYKVRDSKTGQIMILPLKNKEISHPRYEVIERAD